MSDKASETVWLVEDEKNQGQALAVRLEMSGYCVRLFLDPTEALRELRRRRPALIISDYRMPEMDGLDFLRYVRKLYPLQPFIMLSAFADLQHAASAGKLGVDAFLTKPPKMAQLVASIERALTLARSIGEPLKSSPEDGRPKMFIGSSSEGLAIAEALQRGLDQHAQVVLWNQGVFTLGHATLETLVRVAHEHDFAVLVLTADDLVTSRKQRRNAPRDNLLLELGLFLGALGRERTFAVYNRTQNLKLPTDLAGISLVDFAPHDDGNLESALGAACGAIKTVISKLGRRAQAQVGSSLISRHGPRR